MQPTEPPQEPQLSFLSEAGRTWAQQQRKDKTPGKGRAAPRTAAHAAPVEQTEEEERDALKGQQGKA